MLRSHVSLTCIVVIVLTRIVQHDTQISVWDLVNLLISQVSEPVWALCWTSCYVAVVLCVTLTLFLTLTQCDLLSLSLIRLRPMILTLCVS